MAAGAGAVLGAGGAAALGSATGIAIMASLFGAAGAGLTGKKKNIGTNLTGLQVCLWPSCSLTVLAFNVAGYKMKKCVGAIEEFEFLPLSTGKHLHLTVAVTGWLCSGKYSKFMADIP